MRMGLLFSEMPERAKGRLSLTLPSTTRDMSSYPQLLPDRLVPLHENGIALLGDARECEGLAQLDLAQHHQGLFLITPALTWQACSTSWEWDCSSRRCPRVRRDGWAWPCPAPPATCPRASSASDIPSGWSGQTLSLPGLKHRSNEMLDNLSQGGSLHFFKIFKLELVLMKNKQKIKLSTLPVCLAVPQDDCFTGPGSGIQTDQELRGRDRRGWD